MRGQLWLINHCWVLRGERWGVSDEGKTMRVSDEWHEWRLTRGEWWVMRCEWRWLSFEWWMMWVSDKGWVMRGEWRRASDEGWVMRGELIGVSDEVWVMRASDQSEWWGVSDEGVVLKGCGGVGWGGGGEELRVCRPYGFETRNKGQNWPIPHRSKGTCLTWALNFLHTVVIILK